MHYLKKALSIILFLALSLRPLYYLGQIAYYELNIDYIIENYCINTDKPELQCNGKCHLAKQLQIDANTNQEAGGLNTIAVLEGFFPVFKQECTFFVPHNPNFVIPKSVFDEYLNDYRYLSVIDLFKPPQV